jgi:hypothetical protein
MTGWIASAPHTPSHHTLLKSFMSGWTAQRMKMGQTVGEPVAVVGPILVQQSPSEKLTEGTVQQR